MRSCARGKSLDSQVLVLVILGQADAEANDLVVGVLAIVEVVLALIGAHLLQSILSCLLVHFDLVRFELLLQVLQSLSELVAIVAEESFVDTQLAHHPLQAHLSMVLVDEEQQLLQCFLLVRVGSSYGTIPGSLEKRMSKFRGFKSRLLTMQNHFQQDRNAVRSKRGKGIG